MNPQTQLFKRNPKLFVVGPRSDLQPIPTFLEIEPVVVFLFFSEIGFCGVLFYILGYAEVVSAVFNLACLEASLKYAAEESVFSIEIATVCRQKALEELGDLDFVFFMLAKFEQHVVMIW